MQVLLQVEDQQILQKKMGMRENAKCKSITLKKECLDLVRNNEQKQLNSRA